MTQDVKSAEITCRENIEIKVGHDFLEDIQEWVATVFSHTNY